jgi:peptidoglycan/xylan/chitin deacetylase (PgdA/CDA1 family)
MVEAFYRILEQVMLKSLAILGERSAILMLHRVGFRDPGRIAANQNMVVSPYELDEFIFTCLRRGWTFISLDELAFSLKKRKPIKKSLLLTFDDGYLDGITQAAPVLFAHNIPFAVYVTSGFIDNQMMPWWYQLEAILDMNKEVETPDGVMFDLDSIEDKNNAFMAMRSKILLSHEMSKKYKAWIHDNLVHGWDKEQRLFMNWGEVQELGRSHLVTIGAHTLTHPVLSQLSDSEAFNEIQLSAHILKSKLGQEIKHFAYPFGGGSEASVREYGMVRDLGFLTAVTTLTGLIKVGKDSDCYALPRVFFGPDLDLKAFQKDLFVEALRNQLGRCVGHA